MANTAPRNHFINKDDIKQYLTGFGRIIEYGTHHIDKNGNYNPNIDPSQNYIISMSEGQLELGLLSGFCRILDSEGECKIGFWKIQKNKDAWVSRPYGKFAQYFKDGSFKSPDGIYHGTAQI